MTSTWVFPEQYDELLAEKVSRFQNQLATVAPCLPNIHIDESPKMHFRMRAEFKIWHEGDIANFAMTDPKTKKPILIDSFPVANERINQLMPELLSIINGNEILRRKLFQVEFLSTLSGDTLVSLIYHKALTEEWIQAAAIIKQDLAINIVGRSRKQKLLLDSDFVTESLTINEKIYRYQQIENSFTQPNAKVCEKMIEWAVNHSSDFKGDLLELYCGNGNFTLPLAQNFEKVLATEISKSSVKSAHQNIQTNGIDNITIVRMSSEELTQALNKVRAFRRLQDVDLESYCFSTIFVDPPRAGLDKATLELAASFDNIIYISCNPATLVENLQPLCQSHQVTQVAAFDQFPYTPHLEAGIILSKKS